jgi:CHAD domain-containing protein
MPFHLKRKESVSAGLRRVFGERLEKAFEALEQVVDPEAVHSTRKEIKKLRSILRLAWEGIGEKAYNRLTCCLREAASCLGPARDAQVRLQALDKLIESSNALSRDALLNIRTALARECRAENQRAVKQGGLSESRKLLEKARRCAHLLQRGPAHWGAIGCGLKQTYRRGRSAFRAAAQGNDEDFHEWRKRVKDLWFQMRLLCSIWPEQMQAATDELKTLSELLGDDHDLVMVAEATAGKESRNRQAHETLSAVIHSRHRKLRCAALALGSRFYAEKPGAFCSRLEHYWELWCNQPKRVRKALPESASG